MAVEAAVDQRSLQRRRSFKGAQVCFRGLSAAIDRLVGNHSEAGTRLLVESEVGDPEFFELVRARRPARAMSSGGRRPKSASPSIEAADRGGKAAAPYAFGRESGRPFVKNWRAPTGADVLRSLRRPSPACPVPAGCHFGTS